MKPHRLLPLLVLVLSAFMLGCDSGQQTVTAPDDDVVSPDDLKPQFKKPDCDQDPTHPACKPDDPDPARGELITFTGDLEGSQNVEDCCPNAGPFPAYRMTLSDAFPDEIAGPQDGHIFMNNWAPAPNRKDEGGYIVQFFWGEETADHYEYFIEIRGGDVQYNKRTKFLTVIFDQEDMCIWHNGVHGEEDHVNVSFVLTRDPNG